MQLCNNNIFTFSTRQSSSESPIQATFKQWGCYKFLNSVSDKTLQDMHHSISTYFIFALTKQNRKYSK